MSIRFGSGRTNGGQRFFTFTGKKLTQLQVTHNHEHIINMGVAFDGGPLQWTTYTDAANQNKNLGFAGKVTKIGFKWINRLIGDTAVGLKVETTDGTLEIPYNGHCHSQETTINKNITGIKTAGGFTLDWFDVMFDGSNSNDDDKKKDNPDDQDDNPTPGKTGCSCAEIQRKLDAQTVEIQEHQDQDMKAIKNDIKINKKLIEQVLENQTDNNKMAEMEGNIKKLIQNTNRIIERVDEINNERMADIIAKLNKLINKKDGVKPEDLESIKKEIMDNEDKHYKDLKKLIEDNKPPEDNTKVLKDYMDAKEKNIKEHVTKEHVTTRTYFDEHGPDFDTKDLEKTLEDIKKETDKIQGIKESTDGTATSLTEINTTANTINAKIGEKEPSIRVVVDAIKTRVDQL